MRINISTLNTFNTSKYVSLNISVFNWDTYNLNESIHINNTLTNNNVAELSFNASFAGKYIIEIESLESSNKALYNITFSTSSSVNFGSYNFMENHQKSGELTIGYYFTTNPWLFDNEDSTDRVTIRFRYQLYTEQTYIGKSGERWFNIYNYFEEITLFVGITVYPLNPYEDYPNVQLALYKWSDLDKGIVEPIKTADTIVNYSCGFNFVFKTGEIYQIYLKNYDSVWEIFANATFYSYGKARIRYDYDLDPDPPDDQIKVRVFTYDPWVAYQRDIRHIWWGWWVIGIGGGLIGVAFIIFFVKNRYT